MISNISFYKKKNILLMYFFNGNEEDFEEVSN